MVIISNIPHSSSIKVILLCFIFILGFLVPISYADELVETHIQNKEVEDVVKNNDVKYESKTSFDPSSEIDVTDTSILTSLDNIESVKSTEQVWDTNIKTKDNLYYEFDESLKITPLKSNFLLSSFNFEINSTKYEPGVSSNGFDEYSHYTVFPKSINRIIRQNSVRELHIRFTRGFWDADSWGRIPYDGFKAGGSGVELWSVIEASSKKVAYKKWKYVANTLSGMFCTSLNFVDASKTTYPYKSFIPDYDVPLFDGKNQLFVMRAALANENVCTENLTPLLKLLPTKSRSGISTLLDGHKVFDSYWHSLSIDVKTICEEESLVCYDNLKANVGVVMHVPNTIQRNRNPIPKPVTGEGLRCDTSKYHDAYECFPLPDNFETIFLLSDLFGKKLQGSNLISNNPSSVCVEASKDWKILIESNGEFFGTQSNCFDLTNNDKNDIYFETKNSSSIVRRDNVPLFVSRSIMSNSIGRDGLRTVFRNPTNSAKSVLYFESLPWFMKIYLSTLIVEQAIDTTTGMKFDFDIKDVLSTLKYAAASDRKRPNQIEYEITIPPHSTIILSYQFEKNLLKYSEYPPDANHGFEIESAVVTVKGPTKYQSRTSTLLLVLPTPDFSMPYNVIILTSTIMGLIFGTVFNLLVKRVLTLEDAERIRAVSGPKYKLKKLKERLLSRFGTNKNA
ncbi:hypothetical protein TPHA_0A05390 [Tetrapisispora phaffii CBS 4417]|uniref:GPI transamidase component GPI16 n=1 Tax=Tetrapisispora phaffii (strain ATCC 24235 / CBS 4417 / NBRC 1672 / NRRL Y-8282 / UCD 70-5) TaxID=1071381 RepID=G8BNY5_TETPH|nr:hypothetical protein TPHA_0A05390 [Tetrapisispora phaffii CBS 4417]CCE61613.1 hypothetical protein TPHA_0A05390 [Tetrapisispora phaffii CBS 4417]